MLAQEEGRLLCVGEDSAEELIMRISILLLYYYYTTEDLERLQNLESG